jgi:hypothetical protein
VDNPELPTMKGKGPYRRGVADWGQRPKDKDRDDAIKLIEAAAARGQIVEADKLKRIQEVKSAGSVGEIGMITRGLALPAPAADVTSTSPPPVSTPAPPVAPTFEPYSPPPTPPVTEPNPTVGPPPSVSYGEPLTPSAGTPISTPPMIKRSGGGGRLVLLFVLIILAGIAVPIVIGINALVDVGDDLDFTPGNADVFSKDGLDELASDLEEETGSSEVFDATLYPGYAYVQVPAESSGQRMIRYYWDGDLEEQGKGKSTYTDRMDLRDVKLDVLEEIRAKIRDKVEGSKADTNYVIVHAPGTSDEGASLFAYASNEFSEGGYVAATLDGKVVRVTTW